MAKELWISILVIICWFNYVNSNRVDVNCTTLDLHVAAASGNLGRIRQILDEKIVDVNCKQIMGPPDPANDPGCAGCKKNWNVDNGTTALHHAVKHQQKEAVELLLSRGADVNAKRNDGWTALHYAANNGNEDIVNMLIFYGADVNAKMNAKSTPLHFATYKGHTGVVETLLKKGSDPNAEKELGYTAIFEASLNGFYDIVKILLEQGHASFDTQNEEGTTAWHAAFIGGHANIVKLFIDHGADLNLLRNDDASGLHDAAAFDHTNLVELLLHSAWDQEQGKLNINLNQISIDEQVKPVGVAALRGNAAIIKLLLDYGADLVANARGLTVYDMAKFSPNYDDVAAVLDRLDSKPVEEWDVDDVCYFVSRLEQPTKQPMIKLPRKTNWVFRQKRVDGINLLRLDHESLKELGIADGPHQELLLEKIHELKHRHGHVYMIAGAAFIGIGLLLILVWKKSTGPTQDPTAPKKSQ